MTQHAADSRDRAAFLAAQWDASVALQRRIVDWRSALVFAAGGGLVAITTIHAGDSTIAAVGLGVVYAAVFVYLLVRWRVVRRAIADLLALARKSDASPASVDHEPWDRSALSTVPGYYLVPEDTSSPAQLEGLLRLSSEDLVAQFRTERSTMISALIVAIVSVAGGVLAALTAVIWLFTDAQALAAGPAGIPREVVAAVTSGLVLLLAGADLVEMTRVGRHLAAGLAADASSQLTRLWAIDPTFTTGVVVRWTPTGYVLDPTKMTVTPEPSPHQKLLRVALLCAIIAFVIVIALYLALTAVLSLIGG